MNEFTENELGQIIQLTRSRKEQHIESNELLPLLDDIEQKALSAMRETGATLAPYPPCMAPDGAEPCPQYTALLRQLNNY